MIQNTQIIKENLTYYENIIEDTKELHEVITTDRNGNSYKYKNCLLITYNKPTTIYFDTYETTARSCKVQQVLVTENDIYLYFTRANGEIQRVRGLIGRDFEYLTL